MKLLLKPFGRVMFALCLLMVAGYVPNVLGVTYQSFGSHHDLSPSSAGDTDILAPVLQALAQGQAERARSLLDAILIDHPTLVTARELDGILRANQGDLAGAESALREAIALSTTTRAIHMVLGKVLFHQGKYTEAQPLFKEYLKVVPDDITSHIYLARIAAFHGNLTEGISHLERIMPAGGEQGTQALLQLIMWHLDLGQIEQARERLIMCDSYCQSFSGYRLVKAKLLHGEGKLTEAENLLMALSKEGRAFPEVWVELGRVRRAQGNFTGAKEAFRQAVEMPNHSPIAELELAVSLLNNEETDQAVAMLKAQVKEDVLPDAYTMLAKVQASQGKADQALSTLKTLNQKHPNFAEGHLLMGLLQTSLGHGKAAKRAFAQAVELDPTLAQAWIHLAHLASSAHHMKEARELLERGMKAAPANAELYYHLGLLHEHAHQWGKAAEAYRAALQRQEHYPPAMNNLALILVKLHADLNEAERLMRKVHAVHPQNPLFTANLGWVLVNSGNLEEGVALLEQGIRDIKDNPELHYFLSVAYEKQGRKGEAKKELQLAFKYGLPAAYVAH